MDLIQRLELSVLRNPNKEFLVDGSIRFTFAEWEKRVNRAAQAFRSLGIGRGDHVVLALQNREELVTSWYGLMKLGAIATPVNHRFSSGDLSYVIHDAKAKTVVCEAISYGRVVEASENFSSGCQKIYCDKDTPSGFESFSELLNTQTEIPVRESLDENLTCLMLYTSGTTGRPKGVPRHQGAQDACALAHAIQCGYPPCDRTLGVMPIYHVMGIVSLMTMVMLSGSFIIMRSFNPEATVKLLEKEKITSLYLIPTLFHDLIRANNINDHDLSGVRRLAFAGAPMTETLVKKLSERFEPEIFTNHYGSTEIYTFSINQNLNDKPSSAGKPGIGSELRIVHPEPEKPISPDGVVHQGEVGEIIARLRSEEAFRGYWQRPEADKKAFRDGWYFTGDIGYQDSDGDLFVTGRIDDMIISGGENIYPTEIEDILARHPEILESAVIGAEDSKWGQLVAAFVVPKDGSLTVKEIEKHCRDQSDFSDFKRPRKITFIKKVPRTASGKILRRMLRDGNFETFT